MSNQEENKEEPSKKFTRKFAESVFRKARDPFWGIFLTAFIFMGTGVMWALSYFGAKAPTAPAANAPGTFSWRSEPHRSLMDIDMPEVLIGFKSAGRVYLDISSYCEQPGFRSRAEIDRSVKPQPQNMGKLLVETPDISLPENLDHRILSVVSAEMAPEIRLFDSPYQWLGDTYGPQHGACLLLGKKTASGEPQKLEALDAVPIIALTSADTPADLRLEAQAKPLRVIEDNRAASIRKHPWLLRWLKEFSSNASKQCGLGEFKPLTVLMPVQTRLSLTSEQNTHWMAASACDGESNWSLVVTNEDETVSFVELSRLRSPDDYRPAQVWATDTDGDGTPELLVWAQYPKGWRYILLRLNTNDMAGYSLTEIAKTAYVGL